MVYLLKWLVGVLQRRDQSLSVTVRIKLIVQPFFFYFFSTQGHSGCAQDLRSKPFHVPPDVQNRTSDPTLQIHAA